MKKNSTGSMLWKRWRRWRADPERIARGVAIGLFIGMMPGTGLVAALAVAVVCRLHKPSVAAGALLNNPWTSPFFYYVSYRLGQRLTGIEAHVTWEGWHGWQHAAWWRELLPAIWPTLIGLVVIGAIAAAVAYVLVYAALRRRRAP